MRQIKQWILCGLLVVPMAVFAASTEVYELHYRAADEIIAAVKPHLQSGESVSGLDSKLILRLRPENRDAILALIRQIDQRPSQLLVTVRQGGERTASQTEAGVSGRYQTGRAAVQLGDDPRPLSGRIVQHQTRSDQGTEQQVRVLDRQPAVFYIGQLVPVPGGAAITPQGYVLHEGIYYQEVMTGFEVRPQVRGQTVLLDVRPRRESARSDGSVEVQAVSTVVEARLGAWVDIGQVVEQFSEQQRGLATYGNLDSENRSRVQVKVDLSP